MPVGTKVHRCYKRVAKNHSKESAAKICQASTGQALATGKTPKHEGRKK